MNNSSAAVCFYALEREEARGRDTGIHYWLVNVDTREAVVYVKVYDNYNGHKVSLCDIETRPEKRRQGLAALALKLISYEYEVDRVAHDGGYTEAGCAIAHLLKTPRTESEPPEATFNEMTFVQDWTTKTRKYL